jgi:hypothetical protein
MRVRAPDHDGAGVEEREVLVEQAVLRQQVSGDELLLGGELAALLG